VKIGSRAMSRVAVVTDTTQYLPREVVERHRLTLVSLYVNWQGRTDRESDLGDYDAFYEHLRTVEGDLPSTSQPSVGDFLAAFEPLVEDGSDVLSVHLSGGISGTVRAAEQARDTLLERGVAPERIAVLDSHTGCAGHGAMAIAAANAAENGADLAGAAAAAEALRERITIVFAVDTLEFLRRGGRIGSAQAWIGSALKIKPILSIDREILPIERVRTAGRAFERMVEHLQALRDGGADIFFVQHIQAHDVAERLAGRGAEIYGRPPEFVSEIGPVIGAHVGPGLFGVTALSRAALGPV
jgi:DegV family protein with EDD domain